jgi:hypothetical protein
MEYEKGRLTLYEISNVSCVMRDTTYDIRNTRYEL